MSVSAPLQVDQEMHRLLAELSNWGRWGPDDELGTLNLIDDECRRASAAEIVTGEVVSLAMEFDRDGPQPAGDRRLNPQVTMLQTGTDLRLGVQHGAVKGWGYADDTVTMALQAATHWDSLAHAFYDYQMYNGYPCELVSADGAARNAITGARDRLAGRGVLLDVAGAVGSPWLEPGYRIGEQELRTTAERQGVEVRRGDIVLVRTGALEHTVQAGSWSGYAYADEAGLSLDALTWIHRTGVAAVAVDNWACEVLPAGASIALPVHVVGIVGMGLMLGENFRLDRLALRCRELGRYSFFFSGVPIPFNRAVGAPVNPLVVL